MKVTVLGCGASTGVPAIGPGWGRCDPTDPRNRRRRVSLLVERGPTTLLIDTSPDLREQLLDTSVTRIDAVLMTHSHADHLHGIDDLRPIWRLMQRPIPVYADSATLADIGERFGYLVQAIGPESNFYQPILTPHEIDGPFSVCGIRVAPFAQPHGYRTSLGLRIGGMAYSTDVAELGEDAFRALDGVELWIVDCLRREPHPTHSHLAQTLAWIERVRPRRAVLTHMDTSMDYEELSRELPPGVEPAYDGLVLSVADP